MRSRKETERRYSEYLEKAAASQEISETIGTPDGRLVWRDIAFHWMSLAEIMQAQLAHVPASKLVHDPDLNPRDSAGGKNP